MMERYPDIEIYLASVSLDTLNEWLKNTLIAPPLSPAGKGKWQTRGQYQATACRYCWSIKPLMGLPASGLIAITRPG